MYPFLTCPWLRNLHLSSARVPWTPHCIFSTPYSFSPPPRRLPILHPSPPSVRASHPSTLPIISHTLEIFLVDYAAPSTYMCSVSVAYTCPWVVGFWRAKVSLGWHNGILRRVRGQGVRERELGGLWTGSHALRASLAFSVTVQVGPDSPSDPRSNEIKGYSCFHCFPHTGLGTREPCLILSTKNVSQGLLGIVWEMGRGWKIEKYSRGLNHPTCGSASSLLCSAESPAIVLNPSPALLGLSKYTPRLKVTFTDVLSAPEPVLSPPLPAWFVPASWQLRLVIKMHLSSSCIS